MTLPTNQIICGDNVETMKDWPSECVDLVVTSPPYDDLRDYKGYVFDFEGVAEQLYRVIRSGGVVVWVVGDATVDGSETGTSFRQALHFKHLGFNLHDTMIYHKDSCPFPETTRYYPSFEYMFVLTKGKPSNVNLIADKPNKRYGEKVASSTQRMPDGKTYAISAAKTNPKKSIKLFGVRQNIWKYSPGYKKSASDDVAYEHPATFPEQLAKDHIISWSNPNNLILDCMSGSGTTCVAAKMLGRNYIGIDISEEYCGIARQRLEAVDTGVPVKEQRTGQLALFEVQQK